LPVHNLSPSRLCSQSFEKIAKEGRKFGLGLLLSSQRPSELSPTVLSQCNTFLLHRLVNDRDQELVKRFVPDNLGSILNELPVLPTKMAILLGWAAPVPILVDMNELKKEYQPDSTGICSTPIISIFFFWIGTVLLLCIRFLMPYATLCLLTTERASYIRATVMLHIIGLSTCNLEFFGPGKMLDLCQDIYSFAESSLE